MTVCFVAGHAEDAPEGYWRALLPARHFRAPAVVVEAKGARETALQADTVWIHQPTSFAGADLAEEAAKLGKRVIVDLSEDPWLRHETGRDYNEHRLGACRRALAACNVLVVASDALAATFRSLCTDVRVIEPVVSLDGWPVREPAEPPVLCWWSDGRQRLGWEAVAPEVGAALSRTNALLRSLQTVHLTPVGDTFGNRLRGVLGGQSATADLASYRAELAQSYLSFDCYPPGTYADSASDLSVLRAAALGVPTLTTRTTAPPGAISAPPGAWAATIEGLIQEPGKRRALSIEARAWAETRTTYDGYQALLQEA